MFVCLQQKDFNQLGYSYYPIASELFFLLEYLWHAALIHTIMHHLKGDYKVNLKMMSRNQISCQSH